MTRKYQPMRNAIAKIGKTSIRLSAADYSDNIERGAYSSEASMTMPTDVYRGPFLSALRKCRNIEVRHETHAIDGGQRIVRKDSDMLEGCSVSSVTEDGGNTIVRMSVLKILWTNSRRTMTPGPDRPTRIRIAARAEVDPRTVERYLRGEQVFPASARAIRRALASLGLATLIRREAA